MARIKDAQGNIVVPEDGLIGLYTMVNYLTENEKNYTLYDSLSDLVSTMDGDAVTPFNTVRELIDCIPAILDCGYSTYVFCAFTDTDVVFLVMGSDPENDDEMCTTALRIFYPGYTVETNY